MSDLSDDDCEVGYAKPPKSTRFKKGQSGNPKGRPKGAKGVKASLRRELETKITVREGNHQVQVSKARAMAKRLTANALKGDVKSLLELLKLDDELFGESQIAQGGEDRSAAQDPVDLDILRDYLLGQDRSDDGGDDDGT